MATEEQERRGGETRMSQMLMYTLGQRGGIRARLWPRGKSRLYPDEVVKRNEQTAVRTHVTSSSLAREARSAHFAYSTLRAPHALQTRPCYRCFVLAVFAQHIVVLRLRSSARK